MSSNDKLRNLIDTLTRQINDQDPALQYIKHPDKLLTALRKMYNLVGMQEVKDNIADQVIFLIMASRTGEKKQYMLNTVFYGPPGVGKTKVGCILAEIWFALGYIENKKRVGYSYMNQDWENATYLIIVSLFVVYGFQILAFIYKKIGVFYLTMVLGAVFLLLLFSFLILSKTSYWKETIYEDDGEIIKIVSRKDFVAEYVGQTAIKTKKLLDANCGKVLFIDEAYSLINDARDPFGLEALTTLNQFMSEHPDEIIIIFAGYKDKMQEGIFSIQPGLPRRCMWHFECSGYSGLELYQIFCCQLQTEGWYIPESDQRGIGELIMSNKELFPNFGGDTERLSFFSKLESTNAAFHRGDLTNRCLFLEDVEKGIKLLSNNNIKKEPGNCERNGRDQNVNELMKLLERFREPPTTPN